MTMSKGKKIVPTMHRTSYAAISPSRPELSQAGRTVLVTGSSEGIGLATVRSFAAANAAKIIMTGRRESFLREAAASVQADFPSVQIVARRNDVSDAADVDRFWAELASEGTVVDVLVLNVARVSTGVLAEQQYTAVWDDYVTNVRANLQLAYAFNNQPGHDPSKKLYLLNVSTMAIHDMELIIPLHAYTASKSAGAMAMQMFAHGVAPEKLQMISYHPGQIFTAPAKAVGFTEDTMTWDDADLPGDFAVWAASDEASFLNKRFVWSAWDVDELRTGEIRKRIDEDSHFLTVGIVGI